MDWKDFSARHGHYLAHYVVDRVFAFDELGAALTYLGEGRHFGKVCLRA